MDDEAIAWVEETVAVMTMEEKIGQSFDVFRRIHPLYDRGVDR